MPSEAFIPGLLFAAAVWLWPLIARPIPARWTTPFAARLSWLPVAMPWIRSAGIPYLAIVLGFVAARDYGLSGQSLLEWIVGAVLAAGFGAVMGLWHPMAADLLPSGGDGIRAEARWILYRAALWPVLGGLGFAVIGGFVLAWGETGVEVLFNRERPDRNRLLAFIIWTACSSGLFLVAHNFYLAMGMYGVAALVRLRSGHAGERRDEESHPLR